MKKVVYIVIGIAVLLGTLPFASDGQVNTDALCSSRVLQSQSLFQNFETVQQDDIYQNNAVIWNPWSVSPTSGCVGSACILSGCGGSACFFSGCAGSGCADSVCVGSGCAISACVGSVCVASACTGSVCVGCN